MTMAYFLKVNDWSSRKYSYKEENEEKKADGKREVEELMENKKQG